MPLSQARTIGLPLMNLVRTQGIPILEQLCLEERLLRTSSDNWCIINDGTNAPAIVMGMSGAPAQLLEFKSVLQDQIPVIQRFTGGGTVIVDHGTIFVTFICNKNDLPDIQPYPRPIMNWSSLLYKEVFNGIDDFHLRENATSLQLLSCVATRGLDWSFGRLPALRSPNFDYVFGDRKFGGNAQSITKKRWVHHTSFLWNYDQRNMAYLKLPVRIPEYRLARNHVDFVCRMKDHMARSTFIERTTEAIRHYFSPRPVRLDTIDISDTFTPSTRLLSEEELSTALGSQLSKFCPEVEQS